MKTSSMQIVKESLKANNEVSPLAESFVVAPEPLSMVLYGLGGGSFGCASSASSEAKCYLRVKLYFRSQIA